MGRANQMDYEPNDIREYMGRRLARFTNERIDHEALWKEIKDFILPRAGRFDDSNGNQQRIPSYDAILNSTATNAVKVWVAFIMAGMSSPARPWFKLVGEQAGRDTTSEENAWMDKYRDTMLDVFARSNFYHTLPRVYEEGGAFGNGCMYIAEDAEDVVRFYHYTIGEFYWGMSARLEIDTIYRVFTMTVAQLVSRFGKENISKGVMNQYNMKQLNEKVRVVHVIEPNALSLPSKLRPKDKGKRYISVYYEQAARDKMDQVLSVSGYREFPAMPFRVGPSSDDAYAVGVGADCLADVRELQHKELELAKALDYMNEPHLQSSGGVGQIFRHPGSVTEVSPHNPDALRPIHEVRFPIGELRAEIESLENRIREWFDNHLAVTIMNDRRSNVTAREIDAIEGEKLLQAGPVLESVQVFLSKIIDRTFEVMMTAGVGEPPPQSLEGEKLNVEFLGMLAQAQKAIGVRSIERTYGFAAMLSGMLAQGDQKPFDNFNIDESVKDFGRMVGMPTDNWSTDDERDEVREQRAQQEQQMQAMAQAEAMAGTAQTMSQTPMGDDSALTQALDTVGAGAS